MKIVFKLTEEKTRDLQQLKQFDICLLATRLTQPKTQIVVQVPSNFYYPTTWIGLKDTGVKITKAEVTPLPEDIVLEGTHVPISRLNLKPLPCEPQHQLQVPDEEATFDTAVQWLEANRTGDRVWLYMSADNPYYWNSRPLKSRLPMRLWLEWAYWRKSQPRIHHGTRTFDVWKTGVRIYPPVNQSM